jgi:16S rRNA (guanine527-N7)-methyltransferase
VGLAERRAGAQVFHVKQIERNASAVRKKTVTGPLAPEGVGAEVRARIEDLLNRVGFVPAAGGFLARMEKFAVALALWGSRIDLTAHPEDPSEITFHILDSLMPLVIARRPEGAILRRAFRPDGRVLEVGSGAGFPGMVLAAACDASFTLVESRRKRASFLSVTMAEMQLANVNVECARADPSRFSPEFDAVTARAVGDLPRFYRLAASALAKDGIALLYASPAQRLSLTEARSSGLSGYTRFPYEVPRGPEVVKRVATVWRKL